MRAMRTAAAAFGDTLVLANGNSFDAALERSLRRLTSPPRRPTTAAPPPVPRAAPAERPARKALKDLILRCREYEHSGK